MSKNNKLVKTKSKATTASVKKNSPKVAKKIEPTLGRKRDPALDETILQAAIEVLADKGFDLMTMDMVASEAKAGKATLYRRWASKAELVRDALVWMSHASVEKEKIPDTGSLRGDMLAVMKPYTQEYSERKLRVLSGLGSFMTEHQRLADEAIAQIYGPWTEMNKTFMKRAIDRGEISKNADIELACDVIIAMTSYRIQVQHKSFGKPDYEKLLDQIILPALG